MCSRVKVANVRDSVQTSGGGGGSTRDEYSSTSPLHVGNTSTIAVGGPSTSGEFEMAPQRSDVLPRVFNGDYRQLPSEMEDDELHSLI